MPRAEGGGIFVSYRRQESSHLAGRLYDRLADRFGEDQVFIDVDTIEPGVDFAEEINRAVAACQVLLAVIGSTWLTATDERGRRRLDDPDDIVRLEIEAALVRNVRVIPILVEGAVMPGRQDLPESLAGLARRQAVPIRHESFRSDVGRLVTAVERVLAAAPGTVAVPNASGAHTIRPGENAVNEAARKGHEPAGGGFRKGPGASSRDEDDQIPIHAVYYGEVAKGIYHPSTGLVDITSGPAPKATGLKPSPAAREVINAVNKGRGVTASGSRNGWGFWIVDATGELLQSIRTSAPGLRTLV
jgi:TIR domain